MILILVFCFHSLHQVKRLCSLSSDQELQVGYNCWLPHLLQTVTASLITIPLIYQLLDRDPEKALFIKSFSIIVAPVGTQQESCGAFIELWRQFNSTFGQELTQKAAEQVVVRFILRKCQHLHTLSLQGGIFRFTLTEQKGVSFHFLTHSLNRLFLGTSQDPERMMNVQNMIWILVFCDHLCQASLIS